MGSNFLRSLTIILFVIAMSAGIYACATIINGPREEVRILANPPDAEITVDGKTVGKGAVICNLERNSEHFIDVKKDGYRPAHIQTGIGVSPWYWINIVTFFEYGWIDLLTGDAYSINPNPILVDLSPGSGAPNVKIYDTSGRTLAPLPYEIILGAFIVFTVWLVAAIARGYP